MAKVLPMKAAKVYVNQLTQMTIDLSLLANPTIASETINLFISGHIGRQGLRKTLPPALNVIPTDQGMPRYYDRMVYVTVYLKNQFFYCYCRNLSVKCKSTVSHSACTKKKLATLKHYYFTHVFRFQPCRLPNRCWTRCWSNCTTCWPTLRCRWTPKRPHSWRTCCASAAATCRRASASACCWGRWATASTTTRWSCASARPTRRHASKSCTVGRCRCAGKP